MSAARAFLPSSAFLRLCSMFGTVEVRAADWNRCYQPAHTTVKHPPGADTGRFAPGAPLFTNLVGPTYDVASMRERADQQ